ncbi:MAG: DUF3047 domain-containing protein, partial [Alphaproteobacteria bacterium]|nr:DUF3047 domain-containing protein [Alphaproteobacteria bacterium]
PVDTDGISVESEGSVSLLEKSVTVDLEASPMLAWRWRVTMPAPPTDLATKGEDDRSLALYVAFPFVPEEAGVMERLKRAVVENLAGEEAPGRVLVCVWGGDGARGDRLQSPHLGDSGMMTILRPTNTKPGVWFDETIDVAEDYRKAFASEPPDPMSLAIGADTDDTMSKSRAVITDLAFVERSKAF